MRAYGLKISGFAYQELQMTAGFDKTASNELWSKLLVSPLITPIVVPYIIPYINPPLRSLDYSSNGLTRVCRIKLPG